MKKCYKCLKMKDVVEFHKDQHRKDGLTGYCRDCTSIRRKNDYKKNRDQVIAYSRNYYKEHLAACLKTSKANRDRRYALVAQAKTKPCVDCRKTYPVYVMDLDHVRGKKRFALGQCGGYSVAVILKEIAKCDAVCSNCHRIRTWKRNKKKK